MSSQVTRNSDMVIHDALAQTSYFERIQGVFDVFNGSSRNTINLSSQAIPGDFKKDAFYKIGGEMVHRNVESTKDANSKKITADEMVGVKSTWKYGPYETTLEAFKRRNRSVEEFSQMLGIDMADAAIEYLLKNALASLEGAISTQSALVVSGKTIATNGKKILTAGLRTFGDRASRISAWVMHSSRYWDLVDKAIDDKIFEEAGTVIYGAQPGTFNRPAIVTDNCDENLIFGLQPGAVSVIESQGPELIAERISGKDNILLRYQAEGAFNVEVLGYSYETTQGKDPEITTLKSTAAWDKYATNNKATAGFIVDLSSAS